MNPVTVALLTGFLGANKTALLRHILGKQYGYKIAVIENKFGEVPVDDQLIGNRTTQIRTLINGYTRCSRSSRLEDVLLDLLDNLDKGSTQFDRLVIEYTGMADPSPTIRTFFSHEILCQRCLLGGVVALVDAIRVDEQVNQFIITQPRVGYADRVLPTKTDVAGEAEKLHERLAHINARAPIYTITHGDIGLGLLFNTDGFMLEESAVSTKPRFHFIADRQNDIPSVMMELNHPVDVSEASRVMEDLLPESADKLLRYRGMLWTDGKPNRLLLQGVQRFHSTDWDRPWGDKKPHSATVFIGIQLSEEEIRAALVGLGR